MILLIFISLLKAMIAFFVLSFLGTNLVGMIGRGFLEYPWYKYKGEYSDCLKNEVKKWNRADKLTTVLSILATIGILFLIYRWWGILFLIATIFVMISRIPDLYWEVCVLPRELGGSYPVPKDVIRQALKAKRNKSSWDVFKTFLTWIPFVMIFLAFFLKL